MEKVKVFSGSSNPKLTQLIVDYLGIPLGSASSVRFSDGEIWVKYNENIRGMDVFLVQSTQAPAENLMELLLLIDAAKRASARRVTAVIPYYGYGRQDRKDQPRVALSARLVADLLTTAGADRILTMDLHAPQIQGFFNIPFDHLYSSAVFVPHFQGKKIPDLMVVAPDVGSIGMARSYATRLGVGLALVDKRRERPNVAHVMNIIGDVKDKNVLIIDDLVDTAGTLTEAAQVLKDKGAREIYAACTHPVLSGQASQRLEKSQISKLTVTDSLPLSPDKQSTKIEVLTVSETFGEAIRRIHAEESISSLFL